MEARSFLPIHIRSPQPKVDFDSDTTTARKAKAKPDTSVYVIPFHLCSDVPGKHGTSTWNRAFFKLQNDQSVVTRKIPTDLRAHRCLSFTTKRMSDPQTSVRNDARSLSVNVQRTDCIWQDLSIPQCGLVAVLWACELLWLYLQAPKDICHPAKVHSGGVPAPAHDLLLCDHLSDHATALVLFVLMVSAVLAGCDWTQISGSLLGNQSS